MKEDFERLQLQVQKRVEKEKSASELAKLMLEDIKVKAEKSNKKADEILAKAREMQRRQEIRNFVKAKNQLKQAEEKHIKEQIEMNERSLSAKKLFLKKERLEREKSLQAKEQEGQQVVSSLYKI